MSNTEKNDVNAVKNVVNAENTASAEGTPNTENTANVEASANKEAGACAAAGANCRLSKVGGQAVLEGVMMKAGERTVTTCRQEDGKIVIADDKFVSVRSKHKILNLPIIRGIVNMVEMLMLSMKTLGASADALGLEEEESKFEKWLKKHFGASITDFIMVLGVILGVGLSLFLFMFLPIFVADGIELLTAHFTSVDSLGIWKRVIEGVLKAGIFIGYLALVALMPDIKRTFMYHGAEHKTIACFEAGEELTPENAMKHKRFHPRCGTSFMFFMILLGILAGMALNYVPGVADNKWLYTGLRLLILPVIVGIGYEFIMFAGKHDNPFVRILSAPGLWVQRLTTKEPTLDMLEVAIISTKCALRDEFPEYMEFYLARPWEKKDAADGDTSGDSSDASADSSDTPAELPVADGADSPAVADGGNAPDTPESDPAPSANADASAVDGGKDSLPQGIEGPTVTASPSTPFAPIPKEDGGNSIADGSGEGAAE